MGWKDFEVAYQLKDAFNRKSKDFGFHKSEHLKAKSRRLEVVMSPREAMRTKYFLNILK